MIYRVVIVFVIVVVIFTEGRGQFFYYGQEPAKLQWEAFDTPHFNVYYTKDASLQAYYFSRLLEKNYRFFSEKENLYPEKTPVVLHNRDLVPNGFSVPAPLRMEISTLPSQSSTALKALPLLAVHEFRHSLQIEAFSSGFARHLSWLLGDVAVSGAMARLPFWFIEGEAVYAETAYTYAGRGRDGDFLMQWKALADKDTSVSYDKAIQGSYKDFVPDHYKLGYQLYNHGKRYYADSLWRYVLHRTAKVPYGFRPFSKALKKATGYHVAGFYKEAVDSLHKETVAHEPTGKSLKGYSDGYSSYTHVNQGNDKAYYALKKTLDDIPRFVRFTENEEEVLHYPGSVFDEQVSFAQNKILWAEYYTDPRFTRQNYSVIKSYDIANDEVTILTSETEKHLSPDLNERNQLVTVRYYESGKQSLVVTDIGAQNVLFQRDFPADVHVITPRWSIDGNSIVFITVDDYGKSIKQYFPGKNKVAEIFETTVLDISQPRLTSEYVFFVAPFRGKNELYAMKRKTRRLFRLADSPYGIGYPALGPDQAVRFSQYSAEGYKPYEAEVSELEWEPVAFPHRDPFRQAAVTKQKELDFTSLPEMSVNEKPLKKGNHLFRFHSVTPFAYDKQNMMRGPGISVHSQDILSTMFTSAGYFYDYDEKGGTWFTNLEYRGWYPVLQLYASYGRREGNARYNDQSVFVEWDRYRVSGGFELPYRFNSGKMQRFASFSAHTGYRVNDIYNPDTLSFNYEKVHTMEYNAYFHNLRRKSHRDLYPRFGQVLELNYLHTPFNLSGAGSVAAAEAILYIPGFSKNHHFWFYNGYQYQSQYAQPLSGFVSFPRGIGVRHHHHLYSFKATYTLPLGYPEWNIGPLAYFKRLKGGVFLDGAIMTHPGYQTSFLTTGAEVSADTHLLRLITPANLGFRGIYDFSAESVTFEFTLSMNFNVY